MNDFECPRCGHCCPQQTEQEPVAWISDSPTKGNGKQLHWTKAEAWRWSSNITPLYTAPPKKQWVGLTDDEIEKAENARELGLDYEVPTLLPDGSAFGVMSFPLPSDHWIYAPNEYRDGEDEPIDLPKPILTHAMRDAVVAAVRYAVRGATMRGQENDFDPDALVQNAVYALCGPYGKALEQQPAAWVGLEGDEIRSMWNAASKPERSTMAFVTAFARAIEAKLKEKNHG